MTNPTRSPEPTPAGTRTPWLKAAAVVLPLVFLVYGRSLPGSFVFDDHYFVEHNRALETLRGASRFFKDPGTLSASPGLNRDGYRPLAALSFAADRAVAGPGPAFSRAVNLLLHCVNILLVCALALRLGLDGRRAALAGAVFACFPADVESFVWVSGRSNVLSTTFLLAAVVSFIAFTQEGGRGRLAAAVLANAAALLTREIAVVIPLLALSYALLHRLPPRRYAAPVILGLALPAAAFILLRCRLLGTLQQAPQLGAPPLVLAAMPLVIFTEYLALLIWPFDMRITYSGLIERKLTSLWLHLPLALAACLLLAALIVLLDLRKERDAAWSLLWVPLTLLPVLNIVPMTFYMAERLTYLPLVGWSLSLAAGAGSLGARLRWKNAPLAALGTLVLLYIVQIQLRIPVWRDDVSLWSYDVRQNPRDLLSRLRLADARRSARDYGAALAELSAALPLAAAASQRGAVLNEMGVVQALAGDPGKARQLFAASLQADPDNSLARGNLEKLAAGRRETASSSR